MERPKQAPEAALSFRPLSGEQMVALRDKTRQVATTGKLELFKTSNIFDGTARTRSGWVRAMTSSSGF
jgi:hypothetical protein